MNLKQVIQFLKARFKELGILNDEAFEAFYVLSDTLIDSHVGYVDSGLVMDEDYRKDVEE